MLSARTTAPNGTLLAEEQHTLEPQTFTLPSGASTVLSVVKQSTASRHDLDGSDLGSSTEVNTYGDGWGNLAQRTVTRSAAGQSFSSQDSTTYSNDATAWLIGLPSASSSTRTDAAGNSLTRRVATTCDAASGLIKTETVEPGETGFWWTPRSGSSCSRRRQ